MFMEMLRIRWYDLTGKYDEQPGASRPQRNRVKQPQPPSLTHSPRSARIIRTSELRDPHLWSAQVGTDKPYDTGNIARRELHRSFGPC